MSEWKSLRLGDHMEALSGFPFPSEGFSQEAGLPLIRIRDLLATQVETYFVGSYPDDFVINDGDVLIGMDGDFNIVRWDKGKALLNQRVCKVFASTSQLDEGFLFWSLGPELKDIHQKTPQTTVKHLSVGDLYQLCLQVPPVDEQRLIARILDTLDTLIQKTEALIAKLEKVKEGLLHDLLTRGIDENGQLRPTPEQAPELYKDSPLGPLPKNWSFTNVSSIGQVKGGKRLPFGHQYSSEETEFRYLRVTDFYEQSYLANRLESIEEATFNILSRYEIRPGDVFVSIAGSIGYFGVHGPADAENYRVILTENAARIVLTSDVNPDYFALAMNSEPCQKQVEAEKGTGGGVPKLALFRIEQILFPLPGCDEQVEIVKRANSFSYRIASERLKLDKMKTKKQGLMDDLLTGRVRVTSLLEQAEVGTSA
ncbi:restriction endonuclease subunit S [Thioalkalivibrio sp. ALgr3]|uniref:restriction endonuclease subunit S n=1 Tax=Thioalkalivibrio sp. ALgr3 TaxID=1239292 RepID=UPI0003731CF4|nr:restriction endonuclease subunit S [Thioalkalivibrio sp. ALgr3]